METTEKQLVKGFKGFDKNLKCRNYQFKIGKTFTHEGEVKACSSGFHFCENPLDVLYYYNAGSSRFCEVEGCGEVSKDGEDSKVAVSELHIKAEIILGDLVKTGIKFVLDTIMYKDADKATSGYMSTAATSGNESTAATSGNESTAATSGNRSTAATSGYMSTAATSGDGSTAATSGNRSTAIVEGINSIAISTGRDSRARGIKGCWIVLTERDEDDRILSVLSFEVDGEKVKENTLYTVKNGQLEEVI